MIRPWHPFSKESQAAVTPGAPTAYDIEIYPDLGCPQGGQQADAQHPSNPLLPFAP
jgi:hypothetical protein